MKDVLSLALPAVGEMILYMMIGVFDTMMVGHYGGNIAVSSVGLSSEIMYTFTNIFIAIGISVAVSSIIARRIGAKELQLAEQYATLGFCFGIILAFIISFILYNFSANILTFAGAKNEVINYGTSYMKIVSIGIFFNMLTNILNAILRGYGNTRTPLLASLLINVINITLDFVLIFGYLGFPELGIKGAALATAIAHISGFIFIGLYFIYKSKIKIRFVYIRRIKIHQIKELLKLSIPSSLQEGSFSISRLISTFIIMHIGTIAFASNQIATTIESISFMPGWGFAVAATTLVGHKIGEKNYIKAQEYAFTCITIGTIIMLICSMVFLTIPNLMINLFIANTESEVIRLGSLCLMVASIEQPFMGLSMIAGGSLKGLGDTKTPFLVSLISSWAIRLPLMFYFIYILKLSIVYVWVITSVQWIFDGTLLFSLFKNKFKKIKQKG
jgi:putative MATE family efflux protein